MFYLDSTLLLILPAMALAMYAQAKVRGAYHRYSQVTTRRGWTGAQIAEAILREEGIALSDHPDQYPGGKACAIEATHGQLTDHYDPRSRTLRLSEDVYYGNSVAAAGIAAHEVGHAIQHARLYSPLMLRGVVYPACNIGSTLAWPLFFAGFFLSIPILLKVGIVLFSLAVFFTVLTLPVEFNASSRAIRALAHGGHLDDEEIAGVKKVLQAAALTYVAAAAVAILHLVRMLILADRRG